MRFKRQDYIAHLFSLADHQAARDIKAPDLKRHLSEFGPDSKDRLLGLSSQVGEALTVLTLVEQCLTHRLTQKWLFVDFCWLLMQEQAANREIQVAEVAENFDAFEKLRRQYTGNPIDLVGASDTRSKQSRLNRHLYDYIVAFRAQGALHGNLKIRNASLRAFCL